MSIEKLKEQARRHEQKEEWLKALDQYKKAIERLAEDDQPDIGLYNRVGDLYVREGKLDEAVEHYEQAVDLYMEAELPNNAIAVCKKVIRNVPDRYQIYLKMGQIRAQQGFLSDARTNYLTFAERAAQAGDQDESLRALVEFTEMAPDDPDLRLFVGEQLIVAERPDEGVDQLVAAYQRLTLAGDDARAGTVEARIREVAPDRDLTAVPAATPSFDTGGMGGDDGEIYAQFGEIELGGGDEAQAAETAPAVDEAAPAFEAASEEAAGDDESGVAIDDFQIAGFDDGGAGDDDESDDGGMDLPLMSFDDEGEDDGGGDLPTMEIETNEAGDLPTMEIETGDADQGFDLSTMESDAGDADGGGDLPMMDVDFHDDGDAEVELPLMSMDDDGATADDLPVVSLDDGAHDDPFAYASDEPEATSDATAPPQGDPVMDAAETVAEFREDAAGEKEPDAETLKARIAENPGDVALRQRLVEVAYMSGDPSEQADAYAGLAEALESAGQTTRAKAAWQQVLQIDPGHEKALRGVGAGTAAPDRPVKEVAAQEDYVDLGALILGDEEEKSTRFQVAYEEPSGDEDADFAKMLSQFKDKVSQNLDADDVRAHHDLGTAYKEMGLLDEAIAEYQQALRASSTHLATYELMGQTFMEMGKPDQAIRSLERALKVDTAIEDEFLGIYYHLARAYEDTGQKEKAVEFYDRVFSLDINFADVTERLRELR